MAKKKVETSKHLKILGVSSDATQEEIQIAYKRLQKMYKTETSLFDSILTDGPSKNTEDILRELEEAQREILEQMGYEQSSTKQNAKCSTVIADASESAPKETKQGRPIIEEIKEKLDLEESKLNLEYVRRTDMLWVKGEALFKVLNDIKRQTQNLEKRLAGKNRTQIEVSDSLKNLISKVELYQRMYSQKAENGLGYGWPIESNQSRDPVAIQIIRFRNIICKSQSAPSQAQIDQLAGLERRISVLVSAVEEIKEKDIPNLNKSLEKFDAPKIKIPRTLTNPTW